MLEKMISFIFERQFVVENPHHEPENLDARKVEPTGGFAMFESVMVGSVMQREEVTSTPTARIVNEIPPWQQIDRALRELALDRCALDAREAPLLVQVIRADVWRHCAKVSLYAYLEDVLGYGPKVARDRVRVAMALEQLPQVAEALANGEHSYTAVRELTRIVNAGTEAAWLDRVRGCNSAQVQEAVAAHRRGDLPTDPIDPSVKPWRVTLELTALLQAEWRQAQRECADELDVDIDDETFVGWLLASRRSGSAADAAESTGTAPRHYVQTTVCEACSQGFVDVGGRRVPIDADERDLAECDAIRIGSDREPERATKDISTKTRRFVWARDRGKCVVPGCRSMKNIDIHHLVRRVDGGGHGPANLVLLCAGHHRLQHQGKLDLKVLAERATANAPVPMHEEGKSGIEPEAHATPMNAAPTARAGATANDNVVVQIDGAVTPIGGEVRVSQLSGRPIADPRSVPPTEAALVGEWPNQPATSQIVPPHQEATSASRVVTQPSRYAQIVMKTEALQTLVQLGFKQPEARSMLERASATVSDATTLSELVTAALRFSRILARG